MTLLRKLFDSRLPVIVALAGWASIPLCTVSGQSAPSAGPVGASASNSASANVPLLSPANQVQAGQVPHVLLRVFRRLAHDQSALIPFTESRQFAISKVPIKQTGVVRSSAEHGLSMAYEGAKPRVLIIDAQGLIERQVGGRERQVSVADHPELAGLTELYLNLLRGNSAKLFEFADVYFTGTVHSWQLGLVPKDASIAKRTGRVTISGSAREMHRIENVLPNGDSRTLELGPVDRNPKFTPDMINLYFRAPPAS